MVVALLCCWLALLYWSPLPDPKKYALLPFGDYQALTRHSSVQWRLLDKPDLGAVRFDAVVADLRDDRLAGEWGDSWLAALWHIFLSTTSSRLVRHLPVE